MAWDKDTNTKFQAIVQMMLGTDALTVNSVSCFCRQRYCKHKHFVELHDIGSWSLGKKKGEKSITTKWLSFYTTRHHLKQKQLPLYTPRRTRSSSVRGRLSHQRFTVTFEMGGSLVVGSFEDHLQNHENLHGISKFAWPVRLRSTHIHQFLIPEWCFWAQLTTIAKWLHSRRWSRQL